MHILDTARFYYVSQCLYNKIVINKHIGKKFDDNLYDKYLR